MSCEACFACFDVLDAGSHWCVYRLQVQQSFQRLGLDQEEGLFDKIDADKSGSLSFDEFMPWWENLVAQRDQSDGNIALHAQLAKRVNMQTSASSGWEQSLFLRRD